MGDNRLWLNRGKTRWLWMHGISESLTSSDLDEVAPSQTDLVGNLAVPLDLQILLYRWQVVARRALFNFVLCVSCSFFWIMSTCAHSSPDHLPIWTTAVHIIWGYPYRAFGSWHRGQWCEQFLGSPKWSRLIPLLCKLHWLLVCFQVQSRCWFFKALHGMSPGYSLTPMGLTCPTYIDRAGILQFLSVK